jgi:hypothetical protein
VPAAKQKMLAPPEAPKRNPGNIPRGCVVGRVVLPNLDRPNRAWLDAALVIGSGWSDRQIAKHLTAALESVGRPERVGSSQLNHHRRNLCSCAAAGVVK